MGKSKWTEAQIVAMLREHEQGRKVAELCREHGVSQPTFYQWKAKYGGMGVSELKELRAMREEIVRLKLKVADLTMDRKGFPLGSVGDDLATTVAREFWIRVCSDYADASSRYSPENLEIIGMADGAPVTGKLSYPDSCQAAFAKLRLENPNVQLAYARAWSLQRALGRSDRCGLLQSMHPTLTPRTYSERGGSYRGVTMRVVMRRL
jgi:putative transposase